MFGTLKNRVLRRLRVDHNSKIKFLTQEIHLYRLVFLNWICDDKKSWLAKGLIFKGYILLPIIGICGNSDVDDSKLETVFDYWCSGLR